MFEHIDPPSPTRPRLRQGMIQGRSSQNPKTNPKLRQKGKQRTKQINKDHGPQIKGQGKHPPTTRQDSQRAHKHKLAQQAPTIGATKGAQQAAKGGTKMTKRAQQNRKYCATQKGRKEQQNRKYRTI